MVRPGCFLLATIVIIAALIAAAVLVLSVVAPEMKAQQTGQEDNK